VQREVEIAVSVRETVLNPTSHAKSIEGSIIGDDLLEGVHDIRPYLLVGGAVTSMWIRGWIELDAGQEELQREKQHVMGGGRVIPWSEFIVEGESRKV